MIEGAKEYWLSDRDADALKGIVLLPPDLRHDALMRHAEKHGLACLVDMFANFIGLANSVGANQREMIELFGLCETGATPKMVEQYNLPTIFGALNGLPLAQGIDRDKVCGGCAYRLGSPANQCEPTVIDAEWCLNDGEPVFLCHEDIDEHGKCKHVCRGYAQRVKAKAA